MHFSLEETGGTSVTRIGTTKDSVTDVTIPDSMLENEEIDQNYKIYAFIYLSENTAGNTEHKITIPVKARPKPEVPGTPEEPELFRKAVEAVLNPLSPEPRSCSMICRPSCVNWSAQDAK